MDNMRWPEELSIPETIITSWFFLDCLCGKRLRVVSAYELVMEKEFIELDCLPTPGCVLIDKFCYRKMRFRLTEDEKKKYINAVEKIVEAKKLIKEAKIILRHQPWLRAIV